MRISEPMTMATDYLMGALALWLGARLWRSPESGGGRARRWLAAALFALAGAAFLGGSAHGFALHLGEISSRVVWTLTELVVGGASFALLAAAFHATLRAAARGPALALAALQLGIYAVWILDHDDFVWVIADYGGAMLVVLALMLWRRRRPGALWIAAGIVVSFAAAAIQQSGLTLHAHFNHNDLYHVVQMGALGLLYAGGSRLRDLGAAAAAPTPGGGRV